MTLIIDKLFNNICLPHQPICPLRSHNKGQIREFLPCGPICTQKRTNDRIQGILRATQKLKRIMLFTYFLELSKYMRLVLINSCVCGDNDLGVMMAGIQRKNSKSCGQCFRYCVLPVLSYGHQKKNWCWH